MQPEQKVCVHFTSVTGSEYERRQIGQPAKPFFVENDDVEEEEDDDGTAEETVLSVAGDGQEKKTGWAKDSKPAGTKELTPSLIASQSTTVKPSREISMALKTTELSIIKQQLEVKTFVIPNGLPFPLRTPH